MIVELLLKAATITGGIILLAIGIVCMVLAAIDQSRAGHRRPCLRAGRQPQGVVDRQAPEPNSA